MIERDFGRAVGPESVRPPGDDLEAVVHALDDDDR